MVLIRDCKINKPMLIKRGVPAIVAVLRLHRDPAVSATTVQARARPTQPYMPSAQQQTAIPIALAG
jgi:hypothetical protein